MAIEKGLYAAPEGIDDLLEGEELEGEELEGEELGSPLEIEIVDPESVTLSDGSMEITLVPNGVTLQRYCKKMNCKNLQTN
jgi:hypothetical protein